MKGRDIKHLPSGIKMHFLKNRNQNALPKNILYIFLKQRMERLRSQETCV
jgi:hypothetical protein